MRKILLVVILVVLTLSAVSAPAGTISGSLTFSNSALLRPEGESEPAIGIASDGTMAVTGLQWLFDPNFFGTRLWVGPFGSTPTFDGLLDSGLRKPGKIVFGSGDADFDVGSTGTLHATAANTHLRACCKKAFSEIESQVKKHKQLLRKEYEWKRKRQRERTAAEAVS